MSKLQRRRQAAARRGSFAYRGGDGDWDVIVDSEWALGPRCLSLTRRQAIALAYSIAVSKRQKLRVEFK